MANRHLGCHRRDIGEPAGSKRSGPALKPSEASESDTHIPRRLGPEDPRTVALIVLSTGLGEPVRSRPQSSDSVTAARRRRYSRSYASAAARPSCSPSK